jgi:hypothetical protein
MKVFLSYAVRDTEAVEALHRDLELFGHAVWRDVRIAGGQDWWDVICEQIRACDAFVFALSPSSVRSWYCEAELLYAVALHRVLLPIMVVETVLGTAPVQIQSTNVVTYHTGGHEATIALARALSLVDVGASLPELLPDPPAVPMGDLREFRTRIVLADRLDEAEQRDLVQALHRLTDRASDVALELVRLMRGRHDLYEAVAKDLDDMLESFHDWTAQGAETRQLIKALATQAERRVLTPILGTGLTDSLVGSRRAMARSFAEEFEFPMSAHLRDDLPQVAQFVHVKSGRLTLRDRLSGHMDKQLRDVLGGAAVGAGASLDDLFAAAWEARDRTRPDPHEMLAAMPCAIYVTAHPAQLLEHALMAAGKDPVCDVCRWKLDDDEADEWPLSVFDSEDGVPYRPSVEQPLVFHVFGLLEWPDTLVVTEDDYFKFLIGVTSQRDKKVPAAVRSALADSALLVVGFRLDDWDFRTLWQALMSQEGNARLKKYKHIAAQVDPAGSVVSAAAAREYLRDYFDEGTPKLGLFWGSVADFTAAVHSERSCST